MKKLLLDKDYDWESLADLQRDIYELDFGDIPGEFKGTVNVKIVYTEDENE